MYMVRQIRDDHPTMGVRDMYYKLGLVGMGRDAFEDSCRRAGLLAERRASRARTTDSRGVIRFEDLRRDLRPERINELWQSDITYIEVGGRFYYLTFIQDAFSKVIVGHSVSDNLSTTDTTLAALRRAIRYRRGQDLSGMIFHSDGGCQYYAREFRRLTQALGIRNSMCEYAWENGMVERLHGVIKNNYLLHRNIDSYDKLRKEVDRTVQLYNHEKPHRELGRKTPVGFESEWLTLKEQTGPKMQESSEAKSQSDGPLRPLRLKQTGPQNWDVSSANSVGRF